MNASIGKRDPDKQGHRTPREFLDAVERRFGKIGFDLAATAGDEVTAGCGIDGRTSFTPDDDSLSKNWAGTLGIGRGFPVVWLNPPYKNIRPWVAKLDAECRNLPRWTLCLVPYSAGAQWWRDHVHNKCVVYSVGRIQFVGADWVFPKDIALLAFGFGASGTVPLWDWRRE